MSNHGSLDGRMRWQIVGRLEAGLCQVQICREFSLTSSVACNLWKQFQDTRFIEKNTEQGRQRATIAREYPHLLIIARRNGRATTSQLSICLYTSTGTRVSRVTVSKRLNQRVVFQKTCCLHPAYVYEQDSSFSMYRQHRDWSMDQWATVL
ncbi:transposable element Tcb2 transposase [Trichonephila clavipes]|nr:transposable element Tcb2 transposase [Trichonephila clavipes]